VLADSLYVMSPIEIALGYVFGHTGTLPPPELEPVDPRRAIELAVRPALERPPCGVAFSGGRDSSLVLAVAVHVARREGLPDPLPITRVFPDVSESDERLWQERVIRHLGLGDWHRITIHDELDILGPHATAHLSEHGILWPPTIAGDIPLLEPLHHGSLLDGEGGDAVLGWAAHRIAPLGGLVRSPRPLRRRRTLAAAASLAPAWLRTRHVRRRLHGQPTPWLRPAAREQLVEMFVQLERDRPLAFNSSVRMVPRRRTQVLAAQNRRILAARSDVELTSPLLHPEVVQALARDGGRLGRGDRTAVMRALAADLLPGDVVARSDKASFTRCYMGRPTQEFAARWNGVGVDPELVDPDELRRTWLSMPIAPTAALLQAAWLATNRPTGVIGVTRLLQNTDEKNVIDQI
jgi:asparagine synthetase B (glutamine-hydrolysing)